MNLRISTRCAVLVGLLVIPGVSAAVPVDLGTWSPLALDLPGGQPPGNWVLSGGNTIATQTVNADPSFFLNNLNQTNYVIEGTWRVITSADDDFMGFAFGFQDPAHTYIFDWKQGDQDEGPPYNGLAREGFSIKKIAAPNVGSLTHQDFWVSNNTANTTILATKYGDFGWEDFVSYDFRLEFSPGTYRIVVMEGMTTLWDVTVNDPAYPAGEFGFYNYSQENVEYSGFVQAPLVALDIKPGSCPNPLNTRSRGVLPVAIVGSDGFDVADVDVATLLLEGVPPLRWNIDDVATPFDGELCDCHEATFDGIDDLMLHFDRQEIVAALGAVIDREERPLTLTGELLDGTLLESSDCVLIIVPPGGPGGAPALRETSAGIELAWKASGDPRFDHYAVYRGHEADFLPDSVDDVYATTTEPQFVDGNLEAGQDVYYRVVTFNEPVVVMIPGGNEVITVFSEYSSSAGVTVSTDVTDLSDAASGWSLALLGAWPNPVQARTQIVYTLPGALTVRLSVYDVSGRLVSRLVNERQSAGRHTAAWDTRELSGGTYFYRLEAGGQVRTGRASVVK